MSTLLTVDSRNHCPIRNQQHSSFLVGGGLLAQPHLHDTFVPAFTLYQYERSRGGFIPVKP